MFRSVIIILSVSFAFKSAPANAGTNHGGGGSGTRKYFFDLASEAFQTLEKIEIFHALVMHDGQIVSAKELSKALFDAMAENDIVIYEAFAKTCHLKDFTGTCVEFLSDPGQRQLSIDVGRLSKYFKDHNLGLKSQQNTFIRRMLIHEAFRMARKPDPNFKYSDRLELIFDQFKNNGRIDFLLDETDPCWSRQTFKIECNPKRMFDREADTQQDRSTISLRDLVGTPFYLVDNILIVNTRMTFEIVGKNLFAYRAEGFEKFPYPTNVYDCGMADSIQIAKRFRCVNPNGLNHFDIDVRKPEAASSYIYLNFSFLQVGTWINKEGFLP